MKELSIFVDESGDFGSYEKHCPNYLVTMVFHDQSNDISLQIDIVRERLSYAGFEPDHAFHAMPIIRREEEYRSFDLNERRKLMAILLAFIRKTELSYHTFILEKYPGITPIDMTMILSKKFVELFVRHSDYFHQFDKVVVYYDNGQIELTKILISVCNAMFPHFDFRTIQPTNYRLFQAADFFCAFELVKMKFETGTINQSELGFFITRREFEKNYVKALRCKELP